MNVNTEILHKVGKLNLVVHQKRPFPMLWLTSFQGFENGLTYATQ